MLVEPGRFNDPFSGTMLSDLTCCFIPQQGANYLTVPCSRVHFQHKLIRKQYAYLNLIIILRLLMLLGVRRHINLINYYCDWSVTVNLMFRLELAFLLLHKFSVSRCLGFCSQDLEPILYPYCNLYGIQKLLPY